MSYSPINTSNLDSGTKSPATARSDLLTAVQTLNNLLSTLGLPGGLVAIDNDGQAVLGTSFTAGIDSNGNPKIKLSSSAYLWFSRALNKLFLNLEGADFQLGTGLGAVAYSNSYVDLLNKPALGSVAPLNLGSGLVNIDGNLTVNFPVQIAPGVAFSAYTHNYTPGYNNLYYYPNYWFCNTKLFDPYNAYNSTPQTDCLFTCPAGMGGQYYFKAMQICKNGTWQAYLKKNGVDVITGDAYGVSGTIALVPGDTVGIHLIKTSSGASVPDISMAAFAGYRVGA